MRVATYNASLTRGRQGRLLEDLATRQDRQAQRIAEVIQRTAPDILLVNEFDWVQGGAAAELFRDH